jgi:hypothetical protein
VLVGVGDYSWPPPSDYEGFLCLPRQSARGNSSELLVACGSSSCVGCAAPGCGLGVESSSLVLVN